MKFTDAMSIAGTRRRDDGYLVADARVARTGIQIYAGHEVGKPEMAVVRVYRPDSEVFSRDTLASFAHRPVTNDHPDEAVTAGNWKDHAVGNTSDEIARDGSFVRVPLMVADAKAIDLVEKGKRELSAGYSCDLTWESGQTADGQAYDAIQKNIRANHVAIVQRGRAGSEVRIGDGATQWGAAPIIDHHPEKDKPMTLKTVTVDGIPIEVTDQGATVIATLQKRVSDAATQIADLEKKAKEDEEEAEKKFAKKDEEIGTLKADLKKAQDSAPQAADIDRMVADRAKLVTTIKAIDSKIETDGKSDADLRKAAVAAKLGVEMVKDASEAEIAGMFKAIAKDVKPADPVRTALQGGLHTGDAAKTVNDAYAAMVKDMQSAHLPAQAN